MNRLLLVDDEEPVRKEFQVFLERKNFKVKTAADALEAIRSFRNNPPDIVLTDYLMPEIDGLELLRELKNIRKDIPVVLMSAHADMRTATTILKEDAFDFLRKPIDSKELLSVLKAALRREDPGMLAPVASLHGPMSHSLVGLEKTISLLEIRCGLDERSRGRLEGSLGALMQENALMRKIIVSLKYSDYINNVGLNFLIDTEKRFRERGYVLVLSQVSRKIQDYLRMLGYMQYFRVIANLDEAIAELRI
ncbi:MAG: response regulator [Spirochaetales bacterium]|nr:response regulator [Spirochaetales bacterium]